MKLRFFISLILSLTLYQFIIFLTPANNCSLYENKTDNLLFDKSKMINYTYLSETPIILSINNNGSINKKDNKLSKEEKTEGWELLFNGKNLKGWRGFGLDKAPNGWIVEKGTIKILPKTDWPRQADGQPINGADLITVETYENFELKWDWKIGPGGNSGIKYNVSEELSIANPPKGCALGFEYQMMDDSRLSAGAMQNSTGALYDLVQPPAQKRLNPLGEYNHSRIIVKGKHGEHWLNGEKVLEYTIDSPSFNSAIENSKFSKIKGFAVKRKGHIVLQDHAEEAWFKNIKIKKL